MQWEPAIYEHKASLINKSPAEVANSAILLAEAMIREYDTYQADYLTVGLDVYNIEAEALGAKLIIPGQNECPDLDGFIFNLNELPAELCIPKIPQSGRFQLLLDAARTVIQQIGDQTVIRVAASGPFTMAAKLVGLEELVMSLCLEDGKAYNLLTFTTEIAANWCSCLRSNGLEVILFDSMAAPPMLSPTMYETRLLPLHQRLMSLLTESGQHSRELVIGGNTTPIAHLLKQSGANILLCDYAANAADFHTAIGDDSNLRIRRNINPAPLVSGNSSELAKVFKDELELFTNPIMGTGIIPYDFPPQKLIEFIKTLQLEVSWPRASSF